MADDLKTRAEPPLARLKGERPPAPAWFERVMADAPEAGRITVAGAGVETLTWGARGGPGLVLIHGAAAHAGWWRFIAPYLAEDYRVTALSLSGMGGSDWREAYSLATFGDEILSAAEAAGLYEAGAKPILIGHSYGGLMVGNLAANRPNRIAGGIIIDTYCRAPGEGAWLQGPLEARPTRIYPDAAEAIGRYRLIPPQPVEDSLYLMDAVARESLGPVRDGTPGVTWRFDPTAGTRMTGHLELAPDLLAARAPLAMICGAQSLLMPPAAVEAIRQLVPDLPLVIIPEAGHHVMLSQPLALVAALRGLLADWPKG